MEVFLFRS